MNKISETLLSLPFNLCESRAGQASASLGKTCDHCDKIHKSKTSGRQGQLELWLDSRMAEGIGSVNLWGNTPACDFHEYFAAAEGFADKKELHVHVLGAGDARHVLKTMSKNFKTGATVRLCSFSSLYEVQFSLSLFQSNR
eukprot:m.203797 g.203797  ORF g.203797 m.203797 type:complete len:141 (-) comp15521_c7_seq7:1958-2380(-)